MAENKGYSKVFLDFLRMINNQFSDTFDAKEWGGIESEDKIIKSVQYWGCFTHYDLLEVLPDLEELFKIFFEDMKCEYEAPDHDKACDELIDDFTKDVEEDEEVDALLDKPSQKVKSQ